jgi:hypothetical protein
MTRQPFSFRDVEIEPPIAPMGRPGDVRLKLAAAERRDESWRKSERIAALWPTTSVRDIACDLGLNVCAVEHRARALGLPPRPAGYRPTICAEF